MQRGVSLANWRSRMQATAQSLFFVGESELVLVVVVVVVRFTEMSSSTPRQGLLAAAVQARPLLMHDAARSMINTTTAQSGQRYRVRVSDSAGSVTSNSAQLTGTAVPTAPSFTTLPMSQSIVAGAAVSFTVVATGIPASARQWRIGGTNVVNGAQASGVCTGASVAGASSAAQTLTAVPFGCSGADSALWPATA